MPHSLWLDDSKPLISDFIEWSGTHAHLIDECVSVGFLMVKHGVMDDLTGLRCPRAVVPAPCRVASLEAQIAQLKSLQLTSGTVFEEELASLRLIYEQSTRVEIASKQTDMECQLDRMRKQMEWYETRERGACEEQRQRIDQAVALASAQACASGADARSKAALEMQMRVSTSDARKDQLQEVYDAVLASHYVSEIAMLKEKLSEQARQVELMKKTNTGKGNLGENLVYEYLAREFPEFTYSQKGGSTEAHVCDLHMADVDGHIIAIECKNKSTITSVDLVKFYADIDRLTEETRKDMCIGAVFVSMNTRNIPGKGAFSFEVYKKTPVLFVAFDSTDELSVWFKHHMAVIIKMSSYHMHSSDDRRMQNVHDLLQSIQPSIDKLKKMQSRAEQVRVVLQTVAQSMGDMQRDMTEMWTILVAATGRDKKPKGTTTASAHNSCRFCQRSYKKVKTLEIHEGTCGKRPQPPPVVDQ